MTPSNGMISFRSVDDYGCYSNRSHSEYNFGAPPPD
jgi:hypothetical protein